MVVVPCIGDFGLSSAIDESPVVQKYSARTIRLIKGAYVINHVVSLCISGYTSNKIMFPIRMHTVPDP